jgi:hypothetical protein
MKPGFGKSSTRTTGGTALSPSCASMKRLFRVAAARPTRTSRAASASPSASFPTMLMRRPRGCTAVAPENVTWVLSHIE